MFKLSLSTFTFFKVTTTCFAKSISKIPICSVKLRYFSYHNLPSTQIGPFKVYYNNKEAMERTVLGIFKKNPCSYEFKSKNAHPRIYDAGAYIGLTPLYFKRLYPQANITCFEADPTVFPILKMNIEYNKLNDITLVNAAVSDEEKEQIPFYGQIYQDNQDARGNSIIKIWGQREDSDEVAVRSVKLSTYFPKEGNVDFLKLNIEGAEYRVLKELASAKKLDQINAMTVKVHMADGMEETNNLDVITGLLRDFGFDYSIMSKGNGQKVLPKTMQAWAKRVSPSFYTIRAIHPSRSVMKMKLKFKI
ncbi:FkbM family methyltransferase [Gigaspora margarita]|uniref:FkbM family methyltransferase n=1 Tax=Gigaspora margarita TaxID=4874 RepID=A0A8H3WWC8_GIGMA|nr:FkbM family methyltransferase [Gigaspora margarita]